MTIFLTDLNADEIAQALDLKPFQGAQIFHWLHAKHVFDFQAMTNLSKDLRTRLAENCVARQLTLLHLSEGSNSGTRKALFMLQDGETIESVLLRDRDRVTLCISSQVGCAVRCAFCATGQSGLIRNLSPGEIAEQALHLLGGIELGNRTPNVVYMGMGEPFHNYTNVVKSIHLLMAKEGAGIGARRITVSTVGDLPGIRRFSEENWQVRLAISLHAADDTLRSQLVPLNQKYPLRVVIHAAREYFHRAGRMVSFEYVLLRNVNDSAEDARRLADLLQDMKATVNLIPYNAIQNSGFAAPAPKACELFRNRLLRAGVNATLRQERGQDIDAACGQLRARYVGRS